MVAVNEPAPGFSAQDQEGRQVSLADYAGRRVVLWFYPKADTPGCSREGCNFRDLFAEFSARGAAVLGISYDTPADNKAFHTKYRFPYPLLSDPGGKIARLYGAWNEAQPDYPHRNTYVIGADGRLEKVYLAVNPKTHVRSLLDELSVPHA